MSDTPPDDDFPPLTATKIVGYVPVSAELLADAAGLFRVGPPEPEPTRARRWWRATTRRIPRIRIVWPGDDDDVEDWYL